MGLRDHLDAITRGLHTLAASAAVRRMASKAETAKRKAWQADHHPPAPQPTTPAEARAYGDPSA